MNIQIYGKNKCFDTKKAQRYFKERNVKFQFIDLSKFPMGNREFQLIKEKTGSLEKLIDTKSKAYERLHIKYLARQEDVETALLENPELFVTPIVRNGREIVIGFQPEVFNKWD